MNSWRKSHSQRVEWQKVRLEEDYHRTEEVSNTAAAVVGQAPNSELKPIDLMGAAQAAAPVAAVPTAGAAAAAQLVAAGSAAAAAAAAVGICIVA
jgi:hypothetical protein